MHVFYVNTVPASSSATFTCTSKLLLSLRNHLKTECVCIIFLMLSTAYIAWIFKMLSLTICIIYTNGTDFIVEFRVLAHN
jgi:hypothetical protein